MVLQTIKYGVVMKEANYFIHQIHEQSHTTVNKIIYIDVVAYITTDTLENTLRIFNCVFFHIKVLLSTISDLTFSVYKIQTAITDLEHVMEFGKPRRAFFTIMGKYLTTCDVFNVNCGPHCLNPIGVSYRLNLLIFKQRWLIRQKGSL